MAVKFGIPAEAIRHNSDCLAVCLTLINFKPVFTICRKTTSYSACDVCNFWLPGKNSTAFARI